MRTKAHKLLRFFAVLALVVLSSACTTVRQHPDFAKSWNKQYSIAVLPPKVSLHKQGVIKKWEVDEDKPELKTHIYTQIQAALEAKGYLVKRANLMQELANNNELKFQWKQLSEKLNRANTKLYESDKDVAEASIGEIANHFANITDTDLLALPDYTIIERSDGNRALSLVMSLGTSVMEPDAVGILRVSLIDSNTGDIMWTNVTQDTVSLIGKAASDANNSGTIVANTTITNLFKTLPDKSKANPDGDKHVMLHQ